MSRLAISFSGGETSAFMTQLILSRAKDRYDEILVLFMNTSRENEAALIFVDRCDREIFAPLGHRVVWLEAVPVFGKRERCQGRVVSFETAARDGSVYEGVIQKYGIPNMSYPHCNRELKLSPFTSYLETVGWSIGTYDIAIGIRVDEIDRMIEDRVKKRIVYPLIQWWPTTKQQINAHFRGAPFRLEQPGYRGNCKDCWKKSFRKLYTIADETPECFSWTQDMEEKYGTLKGDKRVFFRKNKSASDILREAATTYFIKAENDAEVYPTQYNLDLDTGGGCGDSCDIFSDEWKGLTDGG